MTTFPVYTTTDEDVVNDTPPGISAAGRLQARMADYRAAHTDAMAVIESVRGQHAETVVELRQDPTLRLVRGGVPHNSHTERRISATHDPVSA